ncbi:MAG: hypothetical protein WAN72_15060 [Candidatus Acidiferrales bacterium]
MAEVISTSTSIRGAQRIESSRRLWFAGGFFCEALADFVAERFAVHGFAFEFGACGFDHRAHLLQRIGAGFDDGFVDSAKHLVVAGRGGQILLDNFYFLGFFVSEVLAAALGKLLDGFLALFDESLQHLQGFHVVERAHFVNFLELERALHHAQDAETQLVLFFHGSG